LGGEQTVVKSLFLGDGELEAHNWHLHAKYQAMKEKECLFEEYETCGAKLLVTAFGSVARIAHTAVTLARAAGTAGRVPDIELNTGQMVEDVRLAVGMGLQVSFYGRPPGTGSLPSPEELLEVIRKHYV
jgi:2-oxoglutarate ferredoxin oxidoreductase subunit alpha